MSGLHTYYDREVGKEKVSRTSGKGTDDTYNSKWPFFHLHFRRDYITPRKTQCTMQNPITVEESQYHEEDKAEISKGQNCLCLQ